MSDKLQHHVQGEGEEASSSPEPSPGVQSSSSGSSITWAGALVAVSAMVPVSLSLGPALTAFLAADPAVSKKGAVILAGVFLAVLALAAPSSFRDVWATMKRYLPGRNGKG